MDAGHQCTTAWVCSGSAAVVVAVHLAGRMATLSGTVFTPQRLLLLFCCINMIVYIDRGEHMVMPAACNAGMQSKPAAAPG